MTMIRMLSGDPGKSPDPFAIVGLEADTDIIRLRLATQFVGLPFYAVAREVKPIYEKVKPHLFVMATNGRGLHAIQAFHRRGMEVRGIATCADLKDKNRMHRMDKNHTIGFMSDIMDLISFPSNPSPTMQELENQIKWIKEFRTANGSTTYRAAKGHDDLFMALLLALHVVRCKWENV